jgi:hypothetical protein
MYIPNHHIKTVVSIGRSTSDIHDRWKKMNWYIVKTSHHMIHTRGRSGHAQRQSVRHTMWKTIQRKYPEFRMYKIPYSVRGNSNCKIKIRYTIIHRFRSKYTSIRHAMRL